MKKVRHMTLGEYLNEISPLIIELKKILRKKYLKSADYNGLQYLKFDDFVNFRVKTSLSRNTYKSLDEEYFRDSAIQNWNKSGLKTESIPTELHRRYKEIYDQISPLFISQKTVDISKAHKSHKSEVRKAISDDVYIQDIKDNKISFGELEEICKSLNIKIPKRLYKLKEKKDAGLYDRGHVESNKIFIKDIREFLSPYSDMLKKLKRDNITQMVSKFEEQNLDLYKYSTSINNKPLYSELSILYKKGKIRVDDFNQRVQRSCDLYAEDFISTFIGRLENKTNLVNLKWGIPKISFKDKENFNGGQLNAFFDLTYPNGEIINGESNVITAGGYIQCLHQRYLFKFYHKGKKMSMKQIDNL